MIQDRKKKNGPPSNTKYGLFVIVLGKNQGKNSQLLDLDDSFAASKPNQCEVFSKKLPKWIRKRHILYYRGPFFFSQPVAMYLLSINIK